MSSYQDWKAAVGTYENNCYFRRHFDIACGGDRDRCVFLLLFAG